jgi:hypothetical protein
MSLSQMDAYFQPLLPVKRFLRSTLASFVLTALFSQCPVEAAAPANDNFADRFTILGVTNSVSGSNVGATGETGEPDHAQLGVTNTVWWTWTAPLDGTATLDTAGSAFDTVLAVYTGGAVNALTGIVSNDDDEGGLVTSRASFNAVAGTAYQIVVGGLGGAGGPITLNLLLAAPPAITNQPVSQTVLDNKGSNITFSVAATGSAPLAFAWLKDNAGLTDATNSSFTITNALLANAGNYQVIVTNVYGSVTSSVAILTVLAVSPNDAFTNRIAIPGQTNSVSGLNTAASTELGEPVHAGVNSGASLWWTWTATRGGLVTVDTVGSTNLSGGVLDTVVAVYTGSVLTNLTMVATNDDETVGQIFSSKALFRAAAGVSYQIAVAGYRDNIGNVAVGGIVLNLSQAPDNDYFTDRLVFPAGAAQILDNNTGASKEPGEKNHAFDAGGRSVWWSWVAPSNGVYSLNTVGSSFDTLLAVYTGTNVTNLTLVAEHDGNPADNYKISYVQFSAVAATEYQFAVDGYQADSGGIVLNLASVDTTAATPPANDNFAQRIGFFGQTNQVSVSTANATLETNEPLHAGDAGGRSVWWSWIAPISGAVTLTTTNSTFDTLLSVYTGTNLTNLTLVAENDDLDAANGVFKAGLTFQAVAGVGYQFAVDGLAGDSGTAVLDLSQPTPPAPGGNDQFVNRFLITGQTNTVTGANTNATKEVGELNHAGNPGGRSVWWRWVAPAAGPVTIDTIGSSFDTILAVYKGATLNALTQVAADNDSAGNQKSVVTFTAVAGVEYQIAVDGYRNGTNQAQGSVVVNLSQQPPDAVLANDNFEDATEIAAPFLSVTGSNVGATRQTSEPNHVGTTQGHSVWWTWTATADGPVTISTTNSSFDTILSVYAGSLVSSLSLVAENDDISREIRQSRVIFKAASGTNYRIAVDGYGESVGSIQLTVTQGTDVASAPQIQQAPSSQTRFAGGVGGGTNVEFRVVATGPLPLAYQWLHQGTNLPGATSPFLVLTNASASDAGTYQVTVTNAFGSTSSPAAVLTLAGGAFNDGFANRILVSGGSNTVYGSNLEATRESNEPNHAGNAGGRSVWWKWVAPSNGVFEVNTTGSPFDTLLAIYTNNVLSSLNLVAENDNLPDGTALTSRVVFNAVSGQEYQIAVDGFKTNYASGAIVLMVRPFSSTQTITFGLLSPARIDNTTYSLNATASSGLPVGYTSSDTSVATVSGNTLTLLSVGSTLITASQPGDTFFLAAANVSRTLLVGVAPSITNQPVDVSVKVTSNAVFSVAASGNSPFGYQWQKDNTNLSGATGASLTLNNVQTNQAGNYTVVVTNLYGSATSSVAVLKVGRFTQTISFAALPPARVGIAPLPLGGTASSALPVSYTSSDTNVAVVIGTNLSIVALGSATITASQVGDSLYQPAIDVGQTLLVGAAPAITNQPVSQVVTVTSNAVLSVAAQGTAPLTFDWRVGGSSLTGATNATLALNNIQTNQAGNYTVVITNLYGSVTSSVAAVTVARFPQTISFVALTSRRVDDPPIRLGATSSSGLAVSYSSSDSGVASISGSIIFIAGTGSANITASQAGDSIFLPATNVIQSLTITGIPPSITAQPTNLVVSATSNAVFGVTAKGTGPLRYQWFAQTPRFPAATATASVLNGFVFSVQVTSGGGPGYTLAPSVRFVGGGGTGATATATVSNGTISAINMDNLGSGYTSAPTVEIDPPPGLLIGQTNASLTISAAATNDAGTYFVLVTNTWGSVTSSVASLIVETPPRINGFSSDTSLPLGDSTVLFVSVADSQSAAIQWYRQQIYPQAAVAVPDVRNGSVVGFSISSGGGFYYTAPSVQVVGAGGTGAEVTATITAGAVTALNIVKPGSGYPTNAQFLFIPPSQGPPQLMSGQTNSFVILTSVRSTDSGAYSAVVSNTRFSSTNTMTLRVLVPQRFVQAPQRLGNGTFRLLFSPQDGGTVLTNDLANFEVWGSTNLLNTNAWVRITNGISLQNGQIQVDDADSANLPRRFYRVKTK